jgi:hypothetical protein
MFCRLSYRKRFWWIFIAVGVVSLVFGILSTLKFSGNNDNLSMLEGMFSGFGFGMFLVGLVMWIRLKLTPPEKLKQEEIERKDERNQQILRSAYSVSNAAAIGIFAVLAFIFAGLGYKIPAIICVGGMYVQVLTFYIAFRYFRTKM